MALTARWKLGLLTWGAGMLGVVAMTVLGVPRILAMLPELLGRVVPMPMPLWALVLSSVVQSSILLGLAVWGGVRLSSAVGLRAPLFEAVASGQPVWIALCPQVVPGLIAGLLGGATLLACFRFAPAQIQAVQGRLAMPLLVRLLYGGITEEMLLRWGVMTALAWLAWRFSGRNSTGGLWTAIAVSALVFAVGHLPAAYLFLGSLNATVVTWVIAVNTLFGIVFGWLYWRYGLEAAIVAHALTHLVSYVVANI
jgi:membrane protease YdiL (CAAX protease family)